MAGRLMYEFDYDIGYETSPRKREVQYDRKRVAIDKQKNKKTNLKQNSKKKVNANSKTIQNKKQNNVKKIQSKPKIHKKNTQNSNVQKKIKQNGQQNAQTRTNKIMPTQQNIKRISKPKLQTKAQPSISPELEKKFWSRFKTITSLFVVFAVLLAIGYRNAQIDEGFMRVEKLKTQLSELKKENEQLAVTIENNLNLSSVEEIAREILGMRKLDNSQKVYINLPKRDYIEPATEKVITEEPSFFERVLKIIQNIW